MSAAAAGIFRPLSPPADSVGGVEEHKIEEQLSLSFSPSTAGGHGKLSSSIPENDNIDSGFAPLVTIQSLQRLFAEHKEAHSVGDAHISTSARTEVVSNRRVASPPNCLLEGELENDNPSRLIFGRQAAKKYNVRRGSDDAEKATSQRGQAKRSSLSDMIGEASVPHAREAADLSPLHTAAAKTLSTPPRTPCTPGDNGLNPPLSSVGYQSLFSPQLSPLTPAGGVPRPNRYRYDNYMTRISDGDESSTEGTKEYAVKFDPTVTHYNGGEMAPRKLDDGHHHAQALLLSVAFFFIWTPQNLLAPNLTQAAHDFGYGDDTNARDLYLGSNLALATSVLSLPVSAFIGYASDFVSSRRMLISITTLVGGMAAIGTAVSTSYFQLILSRFVCGSCMSGSVPVVFSLLSDWFDDKDRNAASSGFTAMMGAGILAGQVYAGCTGPTAGWRHSFFASGILTMVMAAMVAVCVREPVRGGKEQILKEMIASGRTYDKKLTWRQFVSSMTNHPSNCLLMLQGFFSNIPWGVMFVFLNDFLSQEKGLTVPDATFIVAVFGVGCAAGGILGGFLGSLASRADRRYLPLFMAFTTLLGVAPFLALLDDDSYDRAGPMPCFYAFVGGCLASMPSVNVRPCIINVNPPEIRGAVLTTANLIINAARGAGPSFLTAILMGILQEDRSTGFNVMISAFWTITSIQLACLAKTLPQDTEKMETELAKYANASLDLYGSFSVDDDTRAGIESVATLDGDRSLFSIENQATAFDAKAAVESVHFLGDALGEVGDLSFCGQTARGNLRRRARQPAYEQIPEE
ncbi:hypothetical protein ACHAXT_004475 [Thalassiosira profunda]